MVNRVRFVSAYKLLILLLAWHQETVNIIVICWSLLDEHLRISPAKLLPTFSPEYAIVLLNDYYELHMMLITCILSHSSFTDASQLALETFLWLILSSACCAAGFRFQL